jgi:hypothetical protein
MSRAKTKVKPHVHVVDQDVPADPLDTTGRRACRTCHLVGRPGDAHHTMPAPIPDAASAAAGERGDA